MVLVVAQLPVVLPRIASAPPESAAGGVRLAQANDAAHVDSAPSTEHAPASETVGHHHARRINSGERPCSIALPNKAASVSSFTPSLDGKPKLCRYTCQSASVSMRLTGSN